MAVMEFQRQNLLNTTTMITTTANNGVGTFAYSFDREIRLKYSTVGYNSTTLAAFSVVFASPTVVSNILLQNHNFKQFRCYYNSVTANALGVPVTQNSATSTYISFNSITVNSVDIEIEIPMTVKTERSVGEVIIDERLLAFERNPDLSGWTPNIVRKQIIHEMPDGGVKVLQIHDKFSAQMRLEFITSTFRDNLYALYSSAATMYFIPFPTTTGWDGNAYESIWVGDFDFNYGENSKTQGFMGGVNLRETAGG